MSVCTGTLVPANTGVPLMIAGFWDTMGWSMPQMYFVQRPDASAASSPLPAGGAMEGNAITPDFASLHPAYDCLAGVVVFDPPLEFSIDDQREDVVAVCCMRFDRLAVDVLGAPLKINDNIANAAERPALPCCGVFVCLDRLRCSGRRRSGMICFTVLRIENSMSSLRVMVRFCIFYAVVDCGLESFHSDAEVASSIAFP
jgi:hypothetical protein